MTGEAPAPRPEDNSLVSTRKSPTADKTLNKRPAVARFYAREWSGEYRVSIEAFTRQGDAPAPQSGPRFTDALSEKAARAVIDSGAYMSACKGGYKTFATATFTPEQRRALTEIKAIKGKSGKAGEIIGAYDREHTAAGAFTRVTFDTETTIGREVSRLMDALQKKYQRGWVWEPTAEEKAGMLPIWQPEFMPPQYVGVKHTDNGPVPVAKKINYCWVAENPPRVETRTNAAGETVKTVVGDNPHVHLLMDWEVEKLHFRGWAEQLENLWGNGYLKLGKIRDSRAASTYLMKAVGYLTKGKFEVDEHGEILNSQGRIRGNRYGISRDARAPKWECIAEYEAGVMSRFLADIGQKLQARNEKLKAAIEDAKAEQAYAKKKLAQTRLIKKLPEALRQRRAAMYERRLQRATEQQKKLRETRYKSVYANKYKATFRTENQLDAFIDRAMIHCGWGAKMLSHTVERTGEKFKAVTDFASTTGKAAFQYVQETINRKNADLESWWQQVFNDPVPDEPENLIVII